MPFQNLNWLRGYPGPFLDQILHYSRFFIKMFAITFFSMLTTLCNRTFGFSHQEVKSLFSCLEFGLVFEQDFTNKLHYKLYYANYKSRPRQILCISGPSETCSGVIRTGPKYFGERWETTWNRKEVTLDQSELESGS